MLISEKSILKIIKIGDNVYENINIRENKPWFSNLVSQGLDKLKEIVKDTIRYIAWKELMKTDWIITKIFEIQLQGGDIEEAISKYSNILEYRKAVRDWCNNKEEDINQIEDVNSLLMIDIDDLPKL